MLKGAFAPFTFFTTLQKILYNNLHPLQSSLMVLVIFLQSLQ